MGVATGVKDSILSLPFSITSAAKRELSSARSIIEREIAFIRKNVGPVLEHFVPVLTLTVLFNHAPNIQIVLGITGNTVVCANLEEDKIAVIKDDHLLLKPVKVIITQNQFIPALSRLPLLLPIEIQRRRLLTFGMQTVGTSVEFVLFNPERLTYLHNLPSVGTGEKTHIVLIVVLPMLEEF